MKTYNKKKERKKKKFWIGNLGKKPNLSIGIRAKSIVRTQMPIGFPINILHMLCKQPPRKLLGHSITHIVFTLNPIWFNNTSSNSIPHHMKADCNMLLIQVMAWIRSTLDYTEFVTKNFGRTSSISRDINTKTSKTITSIHSLLCCCTQSRELRRIGTTCYS